ncbi:WlaTC/HtrL family glycosyltransferase, partial [Psychrobacter sp. AOP30-A2-5]
MDNSISTTEKSITIVTAYFDIGRGDWSTEKGHPSHLLRDNQTYLS